MDSILLMQNIVKILDEKKAANISIINVSKLSSLTDYFVVCNGTSIRHVKSLADELDQGMELLGMQRFHIEGYSTAKWILLDYGEVIVHIFQKDDREFYDIERLWFDGIMIDAASIVE